LSFGSEKLTTVELEADVPSGPPMDALTLSETEPWEDPQAVAPAHTIASRTTSDPARQEGRR